ncbi:ABC transporter permease [Corynebacterium halotolerans]|nr:FtsX-like permease family protein [Corynebacterium halotolerans]
MLLTVLSVALGTAFISGSLMLTHSLERSFDSIIDAGVEGVDLGVVGSQSSPQGVPFEVIEEIESWPNVRAANVIGDGPGLPSGTRMAGESGIIVIGPDGTPLQVGSSGAHPAAAYPPDRFVGSPPLLRQGEMPETPDEVMINTSAATRAGLAVGDRIQVITPYERVPVSVSGIYDTAGDTAGWVGVMFTPERYLELFTANEHASQIVIATMPGTDPMEVRNRIGRTWPGLTPLLPEQIAERMSGSFAQQLEFVRYILVIFGVIALLVGAFNIANTFAMVVGQRTREFALLRSIGVSTLQIAFSVIMEAAVVGLLGSVLGIAAAGALLAVLAAWFNYTGGDLSSIDFAWTPEAVVVPLLFGVLVTIASAMAPARRAGMLPPVQAFDLSDARSDRPPRLRLFIAGAVAAFGAVFIAGAAIIYGINDVALSVNLRLVAVGIGVGAMFLSLVVSGPTLVSLAGRTLGFVLTAPMGAVGRLARRNAVRNPRRSASSALALALGVGLVACVGTIGATTRASVFGMVESTITAPFVLDGLGGSSVQGQPGMGGPGMSLPVETVQRAEWTTGVDEVGTLMAAPLKANNWDNPQTTVVDGDFTDFMSLGLHEGTPSDGSVPGALISATYASETGLQVGDTIPLTSYEGDPAAAVHIPVEAIYTETAILGHLTVTWGAAQQVLENPESTVTRQSVFVSSDGSVPPDQLRQNLTSVMDPLLVVQVKSKNEYGSSLGTQINQLLTIVYALLALAVIIAGLGIINTLLLSVAERTRELGTLRATGLQRGQIRRMIEVESLILSVHGAVVGIALGTFAGWAAVEVLGSKGMASPEIPWPQIGLMVLGAVGVGVVASIIPAVRAGRIPPLEAIER